jgi:SAM-dependent methyltransferase
MTENSLREKELWDKVIDMHGRGKKVLGQRWSADLLREPKRLGFVLSHYKFAAKMACRGRRVLELGCGEGIGTPILAEFASSYMGVDPDQSAIASAGENWVNEKVRFVEGDLLDQSYGVFDSVISLGVLEQIHREQAPLFFSTIAKTLGEDGIGVIGTLGPASQAAAPADSHLAPPNLFDASRLDAAMRRVFHNVFLFGLSDEVVHTDYSAAPYLVALGCNKRAGGA